MQAVGSEHLQPLARVVHLTAHENEGPLHGAGVLQLLARTQLFSQQCLSELHNHVCCWNTENKHKKKWLSDKILKRAFRHNFASKARLTLFSCLHRFGDLGEEEKKTRYSCCLGVAWMWTWWQTSWAKLVFLTLHPQQKQSSSHTGKVLSRVRWWQFSQVCLLCGWGCFPESLIWPVKGKTNWKRLLANCEMHAEWQFGARSKIFFCVVLEYL